MLLLAAPSTLQLFLCCRPAAPDGQVWLDRAWCAACCMQNTEQLTHWVLACCAVLCRVVLLHVCCVVSCSCTCAGPGGVPLQLSLDGKCFVGPTGMPVRTQNGARLR